MTIDTKVLLWTTGAMAFGFAVTEAIIFAKDALFPCI